SAELPRVSVNGQPATAPTSGSRLVPAFLSDLGTHVSVVQGQLPRDQASDGPTQVTMAQDAADRTAIRLGDSVCMGPATPAAAEGRQPWCARVVGLWRPTDRGDPYWSATTSAAPLLLMTQRDYFQMLGQGSVS